MAKKAKEIRALHISEKKMDIYERHARVEASGESSTDVLYRLAKYIDPDWQEATDLVRRQWLREKA